MPPRTKACSYQRADNEPAFDLKGELFRIAGVDLSNLMFSTREVVLGSTKYLIFFPTRSS